MAKVAIWVGRIVSIGALAAWVGWLAWCLPATTGGAVGALVAVLQVAAFAAATIVTVGLWIGPDRPGRYAFTRGRPTPMPVVTAEALGLDRSLVTIAGAPDVGLDDTGEIAWARRALGVLGRIGSRSGVPASLRIRETAWSVVALDGMRRMIAVVAVLAVLFTGTAPFDGPPDIAVALLIAALAGIPLGHWSLSAGRIAPGSRFVWSMASVGAGIGGGRSRTGLPIRWVATMATMVALNVGVALRGLSDRWTHGLGPMDDDARIVTMTVAFGFVVGGMLGLRHLPRPELGFYGPTRRLEESSARRLALGGTIAVALFGFVVGVLPTDGAS